MKTNAGLKMPVFVYGTAWKKEKTATFVQKAIHSGFRAIDTAGMPKHYNEVGVGDALKVLDGLNGGKVLAKPSLEQQQRLLFIQSKYTPSQDSDEHYDRSLSIEEQVEASFKQTLKNLGLNKSDAPPLDSYLLHAPFENVTDSVRAYKAMEQLVHQGKVRQIGISNFYEHDYLKQFLSQCEITPAIIQNNLHSSTQYNIPILPLLKQHDIILQTFWTLSGNREAIDNPQFVSLAKQHKVSPEQLFYAFVMQQGLSNNVRISILDGTTNDEHMRQGLQVAQGDVELSRDELVFIHNIVVEHV